MAEEKPVGKVSTYFGNVGVAAIKLSSALKVGDKIRIKGHTSDIELTVKDIQINRVSVKSAKKGDHIGIKVSDKVRPNDLVLLKK